MHRGYLVLGEKTRRLLTGALGQSWDVTVVSDGCAALALLAAEVFDVAVLGAEGNTQQTAADFVQAVKRIAPETELIILSHGRPGAWPPWECLPEVYGVLAWPIDSEAGGAHAWRGSRAAEIARRDRPPACRASTMRLPAACSNHEAGGEMTWRAGEPGEVGFNRPHY